MNFLRRFIPVVMIAIPVFGIAASSYSAMPGSATPSDSDSVSMGTVIDEVIMGGW